MIKILANKKILIIIGAVIVVAVASIATSMGGHNNTELPPIPSGEAISINISATNGEWSQIPQANQLSLLASDQNGGLIGSMAYYKDPSSQIYLKAYAKAVIIGDSLDEADVLVDYFKYDNGWAVVNKSDIPKTILTELDKKLEG